MPSQLLTNDVQGKLISAYLAKNAQGTRWAVGGRNKEKLQGVVDEIGAGSQAGIIVADAEDEKSIEKLVQSTQAVITAAGPYNRYGNLLVKCDYYRVTYVYSEGADVTAQTLRPQWHPLFRLDRRDALGRRNDPEARRLLTSAPHLPRLLLRNGLGTE